MNRIAGVVAVVLLAAACGSTRAGTASDSRVASSSRGNQPGQTLLAKPPTSLIYGGFVGGGDGRMLLVGASAGDYAVHPNCATCGSERAAKGFTSVVWDGSRWWNMNVQGPPARPTPAMAYDPITSRIILFGGGLEPALTDTWAWNGKAWMQLLPAHVPPQLNEPVLINDSVRGQLLLVGVSFDVGPSGGYLLRKEETWAWDGLDWKDLTPASTPPPRRSAVLGFDQATGTLIFQGGWTDQNVELTDLWSWNGATWAMLPAKGGPLHRQSISVGVSDPVSGKLLAFVSPDETWLWGAGRWSFYSEDSTPSGYDVLMGLDPGRNAVVALAIGSVGISLWFWNGTGWTLLEPTFLASWRTYTSPLGYSIDYPPYWYLVSAAPPGAPLDDNPAFINRDGGMSEGASERTASMQVVILDKPSPSGQPASIGGLPGTDVAVHLGFGVQVQRDGRWYLLVLETFNTNTQAAMEPVFAQVLARFRFVPVTASAARTS